MNFRQFAFNNVFRNKRTYAAYFLSSAFSVMIFFMYSVIASHPSVKDGIFKELAVTAMGIAQWIVYVFSFFFILYSVGAFLKTRNHEFGVLMIQGMSPRQLNRLVFLENLMIGFSAIVVGIASGLLFAKVGFILGGNMIGVEMPYHITLSSLYITAGSFAGLFLVISFLTQFMVSKSKVQQLLQGTSKPKPEPKANVLLSLLAAGLLGAAYYLSFTATPARLGSLMLPVILMTIVGTYFLFTQLSVFIINLLKRHDKIFLRKTNILTISDLAYRIKDNARMFFMVCIVSTVAFCAVGALASFGVMEKALVQDHSYDINYVSYEGNKLLDTHLTEIDSQLKMKGVEYKKSGYDFIQVQAVEGRSSWIVLSESTYNQIAKDRNRKPVSVQGRQALLIPYMKNTEHFSIPFHAETVQVKGSGIKLTTVDQVEGPIANQGVLPEGLIVTDDIYNQLTKQEQAKTGTVYGYRTADWELTQGVGAGVQQDYMNSLMQSNSSESLLFEYDSVAAIVMMQRQVYSIMLFSALLVGAVFFIASGSFLYFRLYTDLEQDKERYQAIGKIGLTDRELSKIATTQLFLLFFVPILVAIVHSVFAFTALQSLMDLSIAGQTFKVLAGFTIAQIIYFLVIRWRYMLHLRAAIR